MSINNSSRHKTLMLFVRWACGSYTTDDLVDWATDLLDEDIETNSLVRLAALYKPPDPAEAETCFLNALSELRWSPPDERQLMLWFGREEARKIIRGERNPLHGLANILDVAGATGHHYPEPIARWVYIDEGLDPQDYRRLGRSELIEVIRREAARLAEIDAIDESVLP